MEIALTVTLDMNSVLELLIRGEGQCNHLIFSLNAFIPEESVAFGARNLGPLEINLIRVVCSGLELSPLTICVLHDHFCVANRLTPADRILGCQLCDDLSILVQVERIGSQVIERNFA